MTQIPSDLDIYQDEYFGKFKGFIRDNKDPENRGRVRAFCPQVMGGVDGADTWLGWAEPCFPWMGGMNTGDFGPPFTREEQKDAFGIEWYGVWIEFERGHPDFPIWVGTFTIAPIPSAKSALKMGVDGGAGTVGGGIIQSNPPGDLGPLNPPKPEVGREVRLRTPVGVDIVLGSEKGGYIIVGATGIHLVGPSITLNGQNHFSSSVKVG
jgi:hypothetical protein